MSLKTNFLRVAGLMLCALIFAVPASATGGGGGGNDDADHGSSQGQEQKADHANDQKSEAPDDDSEHKSVSAPKTTSKADDDSHKSTSAKSDDSHKSVAKSDDDDKGKSDHTKKAKTAKKAEKAKSTEKTSGSYKNTSSGTDLKKGVVGGHKHTICHATGSASNPYVRITPSVSGVFHGHLGHQDDRDIVPPFTYKGVSYSQNWDAAGQALFAANCAAPGVASATKVEKAEKTEKHETKTGNCPTTVTTTEQVVVGIWHATGAIKDGKRKFVLISPSAKSAHWNKHEDDFPATETRTVTRTISGAECASVTTNTSTPAAPATPAAPEAQAVVQAQPVVQGAAPNAPLVPGAVGVLPAATETAAAPVGGVAGAVSPAPAAQSDSPGGVLGAIASAPAAVADTATSATLPFTGFPLWIVALIGVALLLTGLMLRRRNSSLT